jgi:hypothetical protein
MTEDSVTVAILREIRGELKGIREEGRQTNQRLDAVVEWQIRMGTTVAELGGKTTEIGATVVDLVGVTRQLGDKIDGLGARIDNVLVGPMGGAVRDLGKRVRRLEKHVGLKKPRPH